MRHLKTVGLLAFTMSLFAAAPEKMLVYIGTYTKDRGEGIFVYRMNPETGALTRVGAGSGGRQPLVPGSAPE